MVFSLIANHIHHLLTSCSQHPRVHINTGGLHASDLIQKHLISAMVPFMPLQSEHVTRCITDAAAARGLQATEDMIAFILDELEWFPEGSKFFSVSGCKRVYEKVGLFEQQFLTGS